MTRARVYAAFKRWMRALKRQDGFALPTALTMLLAATSIVTAGLVGSMQVLVGTSRDLGTKSALSVAEGGAEQALLHFNRIDSGANPCSPVVISAPDAGGWCAPVSGAFGGGNFTFQARPIEGALEIVGSGELNGASRRINLTAHSSSGSQVFSAGTVLAQDSIHMDSNALVQADVGTGGDINLDSNAKICGVASYGLGHSMTLSGNASHKLPNCTGTGIATQAPLTLAPVNQGDAATSNDNGRFFGLDLVSGNKGDVCWNGLKANGQAGSCGTRELTVSSNSSISLGGAKYSFCKLKMSSNSAIYIAAGATVTIYFDSPEACGYSAGVTQLELLSNSRITASGGGPANVAMLFVGSANLQTKILLNSNTSVGASCEQNFVVYAPLTDVMLNSNSTYCGAVAAKSLELDSNSRVYTDGSAQTFTLPNTPPHYVVDRFVECGSAQTAPPNAGC